MNSKEIAKGILLALLSMLGLVLVLYFLYSIRQIFVYLTLASILALMGRPLSFFLSKYIRLPNSISAAITILIFGLLIVGFFMISTPLIIEQVETLSRLNNPETQAFITENLNTVNQYLLSKKINVLDEFLSRKQASFINYDLIVLYTNNIVGNLSNILVGFFAVAFTAFFFLKDNTLFNKMILGAVPSAYELRFKEVLEESKNLLSRYFLGLVLQGIVMFIIYYFSLITFDVNVSHAAAIAFLCASLNIVPYIGPLFGLFVFIFFSMSDLLSQGYMFDVLVGGGTLNWLLGMYVAAQLIDNLINQPIIYGRSVKSHPLEIFIVIMIGGILAGVVGVIFAVPFYTMLRVFLKEFFYEIKWVRSITKNL